MKCLLIFTICADSHNGVSMPFSVLCRCPGLLVMDLLHLYLKINEPLECNHHCVYLLLPSFFSEGYKGCNVLFFCSVDQQMSHCSPEQWQGQGIREKPKRPLITHRIWFPARRDQTKLELPFTTTLLLPTGFSGSSTFMCYWCENT